MNPHKGPRLNQFPLGSIKMPFRILILGPSQSGKTSTCREILYTFRDVPTVLVMNRTETSNPKYKGHVPDILIHDKYDHDAISGMMDIQEEKCHHRSKGRDIDTRAIAVYDDLQSTAKEWGKSEITTRLATAGRNIDMSWICLFQTAIVKGIEASIREQFTHIFIYPFDSHKEKAKVREYYCDIITQRELDNLFTEHLDKYECLVYDRTKGAKAPLLEKLFFMRSNNDLPPFRACHPDWWRLNIQTYDPNYKEREIRQRKQQQQARRGRGELGLRKIANGPT
jgi:GTPase SAR1 family protein